MAFAVGNLYNVYSGPPGFGMYIYKSDTDDRDTVTTAGYFNNDDDLVNLAADDIIFLTGDAGGYTLRVDTVTSGSVATEIGGSATYLSVNFVDIAAATSTWLLAPHDGTITKLWIVQHGVITESDTTFGIEIAGVNATSDDKTDGNADIILIESSGDSAGDVSVGNVDGANTIAADASIEVTCGGEGSVTAIATAVIELMPN